MLAADKVFFGGELLAGAAQRYGGCQSPLVASFFPRR